MQLQPGNIVKCRNRQWVLLPSDQSELYLLRPLTGAMDETVAIHKQLTDYIGSSLPQERLTSDTFPHPSTDDISNATGSHLLWQSARLTLREGATPFRSLGRISIKPRTYQFVPLLMALRMDKIRMLIADDVGVGKTIEALLIARELMDRGEVRRICVLCPPYLCDQWQKELSEKFAMEAVVIRSGTVNQLERQRTRDEHIYQHYPIQVVSIDFVKSDRNRHAFLQFSPDLIIVDEAHGAAEADPNRSSQQQRHQLLQDLAALPNKHLILLSATPHSGVQSAFRSLLGLLNPEFKNWDIGQLPEQQRIELAKHFVQRTRFDIEKEWETEERCFPKREPSDVAYKLSPEYHELFQKTYNFCSELVRGDASIGARQQRVRYWAALSLLRCVMSSPAAASTALKKRQGLDSPDEFEFDFSPTVMESSVDQADDSQPTPAIDAVEEDLADPEKRRLRELAKLADSLQGTKADTKAMGCVELVRNLLKQGFTPIVWCRFVATSEYLKAILEANLKKEFPGIAVFAVNGLSSDEERRAKVDELREQNPRVLVATDCLSEGINLQNGFNACLHYDLPWNPNRLEQREGRIDRYGQAQPVVKTIRYYSPDNPVDGAVIRVLLDKAREIHKTLGTHVPVPEENDSVMKAMLQYIFFRNKELGGEQQELAFDIPEVDEFERKWDIDVQREKENRTRYAQRAIRPEEVIQELKATDEILGDAAAVKDFVLNAAQRLGLQIQPDQRRENVYNISLGSTLTGIPDAIKFALPSRKTNTWPVSFTSPTPDGAEYLGRNHRLVSTLAQYLLEEALTKGGAANAARCGVIRTRGVSKATVLYLYRLRYLLEQPDRTPMLAEEVQVLGHESLRSPDNWMPTDEALKLLATQPDQNISPSEKEELIKTVLENNPGEHPALLQFVKQRANDLTEAHKRIRRSVDMRVRGLSVKPQLPPDLLGILVLQPVAGGR